ncbi:MAG: hypothetical protein VYA54_05315 [Bdellovibrionota bacterium]|nr:hypothetical protein [Bdellovibrionota bacterium]
MKKFWPILCVLSASSFAQTSYISKSRTLAEGGSELELSLDYFKPVSVVDETGEAATLTTTNTVTHINGEAIYRYGLTKNFEVSAGLRVRLVQTSFLYSGDQKQYSINNTGAEAAIAGFKFSSGFEGNSQYALEGYYAYKLYTNKELTDLSFLEDSNIGDDTREYAIGAAYTIKTKADNYYEFRALYRSPAEYLSNEIFSEAQLTLKWKSFALYGGVENVYSLENSPYSSEVSEKPDYRTDPSELYNSINRSWTAPYVGLNIAVGKSWRLGARYTQVYTGNSTDIGPRILVSLTRRNEESKEYEKRDSSFKEYRLEGSVTKTSKSRKLAVIDLGLKDELKKGMRVDFYYFDYVGGNELIAKGVVVKAEASKSVVKIIKRYGRRRVQEGTVVRAGEFKQ